MAAGRPAGSEAARRRTKIVATLGPATSTPERIAALLAAGVDIVRLNFSHGTPGEHEALYRLVRQQAAALGRPIAVMQDLQGPKIRVGALAGDQPLQLTAGQEVLLTAEPGAVGHDGLVPITYEHLPDDVRPGDRILLDDGLLELRVLASEPPRVRALVVHGGLLGPHKGVNLPGVPLSTPALTAKDRADLALGLALGVDYVALSFVRGPEDIALARKATRGRVPLIAKLEKPEALAHLEAILRAVDGVMVARGDLAVELSPEEVPPLQKRIIRQANAAGKPVITATQMLQSMITIPRPTRAEASDVANAVLDGSDALMLSGETAVGQYPVETVQTMVRIIVAAEAVRDEGTLPRLPGPPAAFRQGAAPGSATSRVHALAHAACLLAAEVRARAVVVFTRTGHTAQVVAQYRPPVPIYAFTAEEAVQRRLALYWGVTPLRTSLDGDTDRVIARVCAELATRGLAARGDWVIIVGAARRLRSRRADLVKLQRI